MRIKDFWWFSGLILSIGGLILLEISQKELYVQFVYFGMFLISISLVLGFIEIYNLMKPSITPKEPTKRRNTEHWKI